MPSKSAAQARLMAAAAHTPGGYGGVPQSVGKEFNTADAGTGILRKKHADGGSAVPWFIKREATEIYHPSGFLHSTGAGRADTLPRAVGAESHVIPADVVAGLGDGNSLAGAAVMNKILSTGPFGTPLRRHRADGGGVEPEKVPVQLSGGEYVIGPEQVAAWGGGDVAKGHRAIDKFILSVRKHSIAKMKKLPPPKR